MKVTARLGMLATLLVTGCASGPTEHTVHFLAAADLNPNSAGKNTPVNVRVFQLTDDKKFEAADFEALWSDDPKVLGASLVEVKQAVIATTPRESGLPLVSGDKVRFVGIVGLFNRDQGPWKECVPVAEVESWRFEFRDYAIVKEPR